MLSGDLDPIIDVLYDIGADGLHLSSQQLMALSRRPVQGDVWLAASCHDSDEIRQAAGVDVDFVTVSPLLSTQSHPQAPVMGWSQFQALVEPAVMPVYALGGMTDEHVSQAWAQGGQGIAAISSLWGNRVVTAVHH
jgi:8-oxo-dGTP diphosphatase